MSDPAATPAEDQALQQALERLLWPLAQLAVARGVPYAAIDETLRTAFVSTAHAAHPDLPEHRRASRISAATGLHRREVNRLLGRAAQPAPDAPARSPAAMVFAHWRADKHYRTKAGAPRILPRVGPAPSFESLAQEVTRDVHPRALLEELLRLKLATLDAGRDTVRLTGELFMPRGDAPRMLGYLGANVGDHFQAAVDNVLGRQPTHFEQAIAADGLSAASLAQLRPLLLDHWRRLTEALVPLLETMIEVDAARPGSDNTHRIRLGLYGFDSGRDAAPVKPAPAARKQRRKTAP
ncbi:MAG: DUF6502 family protein [Burkholderiaceae bacterium]|nr:DUF6502 family protein [Burkholderiaceae bacterium]